jgi:2-C-methyl-D-erythritol 2,4-cyclodiphosphate synthase
MGYDVHRLVEGRDLIIGGEHIPYDKGLLGHSDADVLVHAIMDAILGAAALGDIGKHFPDTEENFKGIDSLILLAMTRGLIEAEHFMIENIDATIIAQAPKMRPYIDKMRENIASVLSIDVSQINIKATTEEGLGFTGSGEGIAAQAICMLTSPREFATMDMSNVDLSSINTKTEVTIEEGTCDPAACGNCPLGDGCVKRS